MNTDPFEEFAKRLASEPSLLDIAEEQSLRDLLLDLSSGFLTGNTADDVTEIIRTNPRAAAIWKEFCEIDTFMQSDAGRQWAVESHAHVVEKNSETSFQIAQPATPSRAVKKHAGFMPARLAAQESTEPPESRIFKLGESDLRLRAIALDGGMVGFLLCDKNGHGFRDTSGWTVVLAGNTVPIKNGEAMFSMTCLEGGFQIRCGDGSLLIPQPLTNIQDV